MDLAERAARDKANATMAKDEAQKKLDEYHEFRPANLMSTGVTQSERDIVVGLDASKKSLSVIAEHPFDAMLEAEVSTASDTRTQLWYANERTATNEILSSQIQIASWTHPIVQIALSGPLGKMKQLEAIGFRIRSVIPIARATFQALMPVLRGLYEPGGVVDEAPQSAPLAKSSGLKAVKLSMTAEQVDAFLSRMDGILVITGAPGTGKTTVAFQRIRFLFDQQSTREPQLTIAYNAENTRVFLANENLVHYTRDLLVSELDIASESVQLVSKTVSDYLNAKWLSKNDARLRVRIIDHAEQRAREAFFNLCRPVDLKRLWEAYEKQVQDRLSHAKAAAWYKLAEATHRDAAAGAVRLAQALATRVPLAKEPKSSKLRCDELYKRVSSEYVACRAGFSQGDLTRELRDDLIRKRDLFDDAFAKWLYFVYDPIDVLAAYFERHLPEGIARVQKGTLSLLDPETVIRGIFRDWSGEVPSSSPSPSTRNTRQYGPEEESWIAWLLRFILPEDASQGFRGIPSAFPTMRRWTHVVIDEAQDLSVQEASFLASFADPRGALTLSADFRQIVSPVHGMEDITAVEFGSAISALETYSFPFKRNMRQSREIGLFLEAFYRVSFGGIAPFDAGDRSEGVKPALFTANYASFPKIIAQRMEVLKKSPLIQTVALLQINDDPKHLRDMRSSLIAHGVTLAPEEALTGKSGELIVTSVERAKGLEFDCCIILGMDDVERAALNYTKNRAYVALSRPTRRLFILCEQVPALFQRISSNLYEHRSLQ